MQLYFFNTSLISVNLSIPAYEEIFINIPSFYTNHTIQAARGLPAAKPAA